MNWRLITTVYLSDPNRNYVLVSLISNKGSSYLKPGARMLVREDGLHWGSVSAGCLEEQLSEIAVHCIRTGNNRTLTMDTRPHYGCFGEITLLFEVLSDRPMAESLFREIAALMEKRESFTLLTPDTYPACGLATRIAADGEGLIEHIAPAPRLHIFGDWPDGMALAKLAKELEWQVVVHDASDPRFDPEETTAAIEPDPLTAIMVMTHNLARDCNCLRHVLPRNYRYVGVIGSRKRRDALVDELTNFESLPVLEALDAFYCPAGLELGGEGPGPIALSVLAQIQAVFNAGKAGVLDKVQQAHYGSGTDAEQERA